MIASEIRGSSGNCYSPIFGFSIQSTCTEDLSHLCVRKLSACHIVSGANLESLCLNLINFLVARNLYTSEADDAHDREVCKILRLRQTDILTCPTPLRKSSVLTSWVSNFVFSRQRRMQVLLCAQFELCFCVSFSISQYPCGYNTALRCAAVARFNAFDI